MRDWCCRFAVLGCVVTAAVARGQQPASTPLAAAVDPFVGTDPNPFTKDGYSFDTGNVFPGAVCPRGMVAWSPDTTHAKQIAGGYWYPDSKVDDFSLTHFSGRGVPCLKDFAFMPLTGPLAQSPAKKGASVAAGFSHKDESAAPGYYHVKLDDGIDVQLTATPRTGMAVFAYPEAAEPTLMIRANGHVEVHGDEVAGRADWKPGRPKIYFFARFSRPVQASKTWVGDDLTDQPTADGPLCGAVLSFGRGADPVTVRVGISYTSAENAKANLAAENADGDFATIRQAAAALWERDLGRVEITGGTDPQRRVFYTAMYHCLIHPNLLDDANGQYRGMDEKVHAAPAGHHQYQNIPAWDQHRSYSALMAVLSPSQASDVMQSLVNYAEQDAAVRPKGGGLPRWEQVNTSSGGMVGDGDDTILATSYAFGATAFDAKAALAAMEKGASRPGTTSDGHLVRDGLAEYQSLGYVPNNAAVTLEYCNDDFALAQFARALGDAAAAAGYEKRAGNWKNLLDPATGYLRPREKNGDWQTPFTPTTDKGFVEGTAAQYLWMVNCDFPGLIDRLGGNDKAVARLDQFFTKTNAGLHSPFAYMGNEPCEGTPWIYDFAAAPWRTQETVRRIQTELFTDHPNGLPGNDDAGSLSSWYVFSALGLYPEIPGVAGFAVGSPMFPEATIHLENGKSLRIVGTHAAADAPYVQSMTVNGRPHAGPWVNWSSLSGGGVVTFDLSTAPSKWGGNPADGPPAATAER